jgi:hypothetical protein
MVTPGVYDLAALAITTALTNSAQTAITGLDGMSAANIVAELLGGTGGTTIVGLVQTSVDGGTVWLDVARFDFNTADSPPTAGKKYCVLQTNAAKAITQYAALAAEGMNDGLLGDRMRAVLTSTGTYTDTTLSIRVAVH